MNFDFLELSISSNQKKFPFPQTNTIFLRQISQIPKSLEIIFVLPGGSRNRDSRSYHCITPGGGGKGVLPSNGLLGMYRWMGSHFHDSTDYNGVIFSSIFNRVTRMGWSFFGTLTV